MTILLLLAMLAVPDRVLTPGLIQPLTLETVCSTKWGLDVRHVSEHDRRQAFANYRLRWDRRDRYVVDHLVPRELAGADDIRNLWPQLKRQAKVKDREENRLHRAVCAGLVTLGDAQDAMRQWGRP